MAANQPGNVPTGHTVQSVMSQLLSENRAQAKRIAKLEAALEAEPVAWLHTMHYETGETDERVSLGKWNPWGKPGRDYSEDYKVTCEPLFRKAIS